MILDERMLIKMGIAALLPGFRHMRQIIDEHEAEYKALLENIDTAPPLKRGRPSKASKTILNAIAAATALSAPEAENEKPKKTSRKPRHSAQGLANISKAQKERWARTKAKQKKSAKKLPEVNLTRRGTEPKGNFGWANMTPEERSAEAKRRQAVRRGEAPSQAIKKNTSWYRNRKGAVAA